MTCYKNGGCGIYEMYSCSECPASKPEYLNKNKKVMTNADKIRSMTDEELAKFIFSMVDCISCQNKLMNNGNPFGKERCNKKDYYSMCNGDGRKCEEVCLKWLRGTIDST